MAPVRHHQILTHRDTTYHDVLTPAVLRLCDTSIVHTSILDIGCGTGHFTRQLSEKAQLVVGVDPSPRSIGIAERVTANIANTMFFVGTIEHFSDVTTQCFDTAVANMTLMDCLHLDLTVASIAKLLRCGAPLVCTITHPCYWPIYWGYQNESWFDYSSEITIEAPFRITAECTDILTTHVHRPLERYALALATHGFVIEQLIELMPTTTPIAPAWRFPRYLAFRATLAHKGAC